MNKDRSQYIANHREEHQADITRLQTQEHIQNRHTAIFLDQNLDSSTFDRIVIPFVGSGSVVEVLKPYLSLDGVLIGNDASQEKVDSFLKNAGRFGFENVEAVLGPAGSVTDKMYDGKGKSLTQIRLGLIWDPNYQNTVNQIANSISSGSFVLLEDLNVSMTKMEPRSRSLEFLFDALIKWRGNKMKLENEMGTKLSRVSKAAGLKVVAENSYQTPSHFGDNHHMSVYEFLRMAKVPMNKFDVINETDFEQLMAEYKKDLENPKAVMYYPRITQVLAKKN